MYIITIYLYQTIRVFWSSVLGALQACPRPMPPLETWKLGKLYLTPPDFKLLHTFPTEQSQMDDDLPKIQLTAGSKLLHQLLHLL